MLVTGADGRRSVLKVGNRQFGRDTLLLQNAAMAHVCDLALPFATPRTLPTTDGRTLVTVERDGAEYDVRVLSYVEGVSLRSLHARPRWARRMLGQAAATIAHALADYSHPGADRSFQWSLDRAPAVISALAADLSAFHRRLVERALAGYEAVVPLRQGQLRRQVLHGDVTEYNLVLLRDEAGRLVGHGLIDFGDLAEGFLVSEAAVSAAAAARHEPDDALAALIDVVRAFHEVSPLEEAELEALFPLVPARSALSAASAPRRAAVEPANVYVTADVRRLWAVLELLVEVPAALAEALLRLACGLPARRQRLAGVRSLAERARPIVDLVDQTAVVVDLSARSDRFRSGGCGRGQVSVTPSRSLREAWPSAGLERRGSCTRSGEPLSPPRCISAPTCS